MKMALKTSLISSFAKFIIGANTFDRIKFVVGRLDDTDLSGTEKRKLALDEVNYLLTGVAAWAINLGIELAVAWFRSKAGEKPNG